MNATREFCCRYFHDGSWWGLNINAYDSADAAARVAKLGNLQLLGELMLTIPARDNRFAWLVQLLCKARNLFS